MKIQRVLFIVVLLILVVPVLLTSCVSKRNVMIQHKKIEEAIRVDDYQTLDSLLRHVPQKNVNDFNGYNAINYAILNRSVNCLSLLLDNNLLIESSNPNGVSYINVIKSSYKKWVDEVFSDSILLHAESYDSLDEEYKSIKEEEFRKIQLSMMSILYSCSPKDRELIGIYYIDSILSPWQSQLKF